MNLPTSQVRICLLKTLEVDTLFQLRAYSSNNAKKGAQHSQIICVCSSWENSALKQEGPSPMIHQRPTYMILIYFDDWQQLRLHGLAASDVYKKSLESTGLHLIGDGHFLNLSSNDQDK